MKKKMGEGKGGHIIIYIRTETETKTERKAQEKDTGDVKEVVKNDGQDESEMKMLIKTK